MADGGRTLCIVVNPDQGEASHESAIPQAVPPSIQPGLANSARRTRAAGRITKPEAKRHCVIAWTAVQSQQPLSVAGSARQDDKAVRVGHAKETETSTPAVDFRPADVANDFGAHGRADAGHHLAKINLG